MSDHAELRKMLESRLQELSERLEEIDDDLREHEDEADERASEIASDEVLEGLGVSGQREIEQIQAALMRLDRGTYGICTTCGEPIGEARLQAVPYAARCVECESTARSR